GRKAHLPTRGVYRKPAERGDLHAVVRRRGGAALVARPHGAANLRAAITKAEVPVSRAVSLEVAHLAAHPERNERPLENVAGGLGQCGYGDGRRCRRAGKLVADLLVVVQGEIVLQPGRVELGRRSRFAREQVEVRAFGPTRPPPPGHSANCPAARTVFTISMA